MIGPATCMQEIQVVASLHGTNMKPADPLRGFLVG